MTLEERMNRVEKTNRKLTIITCIMGIALLLVITIGTGKLQDLTFRMSVADSVLNFMQTKIFTNTVIANEIKIVDDAGTLRASLFIKNNVSRLTLWDAEGNQVYSTRKPEYDDPPRLSGGNY